MCVFWHDSCKVGFGREKVDSISMRQDQIFYGILASISFYREVFFSSLLKNNKLRRNYTTAHVWCSNHSININVCEVWGAKTEIQVSKRKFHTHIHLD